MTRKQYKAKLEQIMADPNASHEDREEAKINLIAIEKDRADKKIAFDAKSGKPHLWPEDIVKNLDEKSIGRAVEARGLARMSSGTSAAIMAATLLAGSYSPGRKFSL